MLLFPEVTLLINVSENSVIVQAAEECLLLSNSVIVQAAEECLLLSNSVIVQDKKECVFCYRIL